MNFSNALMQLGIDEEQMSKTRLSPKTIETWKRVGRVSNFKIGIIQYEIDRATDNLRCTEMFNQRLYRTRGYEALIIKSRSQCFVAFSCRMLHSFRVCTHDFKNIDNAKQILYQFSNDRISLNPSVLVPYDVIKHQNINTRVDNSDIYFGDDCFERMTLGKLREQWNLSQQAFAEKMNVSDRTISRMEMREDIGPDVLAIVNDLLYDISTAYQTRADINELKFLLLRSRDNFVPVIFCDFRDDFLYLGTYSSANEAETVAADFIKKHSDHLKHIFEAKIYGDYSRMVVRRRYPVMVGLTPMPTSAHVSSGIDTYDI